MNAINTRLTLGQALEISTARQFIGGQFVSPAEVLAMREWLADCAVELCHTGEEAEDNLSRVATATSAQVVRWVARSYAGGVAGFLGDGPADLGPVVEVEQASES
jgi:hypothetical protein